MVLVRAMAGGQPLRRIDPAMVDGAEAMSEKVTHGTGGGLA